MYLKFFTVPTLILCTYLSSCSGDSDKSNMADTLTPPDVKKEEYIHHEHGNKRIDNYYWMRLTDEQKNADVPDEQTKAVLDYLEAENEYTDKKLAHTKNLQDKIYQEIIDRIDPNEQSAPVIENGYSYFEQYDEGQDYPTYCRKLTGDSVVQIILNGPELAGNKSYFEVGSYEVSPNNQLMVYGVDTVSRRNYTLYIKDLTTGTTLADCIDNTTGYAVWANDNKTIFYTKRDELTLRECYIYKHVLGTDAKQDVLVYEEKDETFSCDVYKSKSKQFIMIGSYQTMATEHRFLNANTPDGAWQVVQPRERGLEYHVEDFGNDFYIRTNLNAKNFRLVRSPITNPSKSNWVDVIPHRDDVMLESFEIFQEFLVLSERKNGLTQLRVRRWADKADYYLEFTEPAYFAMYHDNHDYNTSVLRYSYTSLTTPQITYEFDMSTKKQTIIWQQKIMDTDFKTGNYTAERIYATASDGTLIPISLVYKKGTEKNGKNPLLLYAYGSYGSNEEPYFSQSLISLLDRGFIYAIAHVRGGQEMGRDWYENGKLLKKKNTFTDFISCAEYLVAQQYTTPAHLYANGASAGGLLMGAIVNMRPDLWNGVIAGVPFVDVISTMWDETIPLTTYEFDEWGNPKQKEYYDYMLSYSPYDNVEATSYPNMLVTTGFWDSQVQYWEPTKWVAKLRDLKTDDNMLLLHCNMDVGHGGASGRYEKYREVALEYAFLLNLEGIKE